MRVVLIAHDDVDALGWQVQQPSLGAVEVVTIWPRTAGRCRGLTADAVLVTDKARRKLTDGEYRALLHEALPVVASGGTVVRS